METASPVKKNIVIVIDQSLSMSSEGKMDLAKDAANTVLDTLSPQDNASTRSTKKMMYIYTLDPERSLLLLFFLRNKHMTGISVLKLTKRSAEFVE